MIRATPVSASTMTDDKNNKSSSNNNNNLVVVDDRSCDSNNVVVVDNTTANNKMQQLLLQPVLRQQQHRTSSGIEAQQENHRPSSISSGDTSNDTFSFGQHQQQQQLKQESQIDNHSQQQQQQQQQQKQQQQSDNDKQGDNNRPKRNPYCSRCRNHGKQAQVKGHKRHCEYRYCRCDGCKLVECRQIVSAAQIKRRRYQKQDEECGRHIEVSPPVLTREPGSDPAELIARTLIGSSPSMAVAAAAAAASQVHHSNHNANSPPSSSSTSSLPLVSPHQHPAFTSIAGHLNHQLQHHSHSSTTSNNINNNNNHRSQHSVASSAVNQPAGAGPLTSSSRQTGSPGSLAASTALGNALHLFHFPGSLLSSAAAAASSFSAPALPTVSGSAHDPSSIGNVAAAYSSRMAAAVAAAATRANGPSAHLSMSPSSSSPASPQPSLREQISLIEEIQLNFGPLAIYAWLRAEQFDVQKIRDIIELSRMPFEELLQTTGHSPLDLTSPIVD